MKLDGKEIHIVNSVTGMKIPLTECVLKCPSETEIFKSSGISYTLQMEYTDTSIATIVFKPDRIEGDNYIYKSDCGMEVTLNFK